MAIGRKSEPMSVVTAPRHLGPLPPDDPEIAQLATAWRAQQKPRPGYRGAPDTPISGLSKTYIYQTFRLIFWMKYHVSQAALPTVIHFRHPGYRL